MAVWKVIKFDPFTHECTSRNDKTGELISVTIPAEHRTAEKSAQFLDAYHAARTPIEVKKRRYWAFLYAVGVILAATDIYLRLYG